MTTSRPDWPRRCAASWRSCTPSTGRSPAPVCGTTLSRIGARIPLETHEVPTGTEVFDWVVPQEWSIRQAWVADPSGRRLIDYAESNLNIVGHSEPVNASVPLAELLERLNTLPDQPDVVPYRTSPYQRTWGFNTRHRTLSAFTAPTYDVVIDADLVDGAMTYGECVLPGTSDDEIVISTHACHPSLANDNVSGLVVATFLAAALADRPRRHTFRFLFVPGTIGSIAWLANNPEGVGRIRHGLVLAGVGDAGPPTYQRTFAGDARVDEAVTTASA